MQSEAAEQSSAVWVTGHASGCSLMAQDVAQVDSTPNNSQAVPIWPNPIVPQQIGFVDGQSAGL